VDVIGIPGEVFVLYGVEAKMAFLNAVEPNLRQVRILADLGVPLLNMVGVLRDDQGYVDVGISEVIRSVESEQSWRYSRYIDLDAPRTAMKFRDAIEAEDRRDPAYRATLSPELDEIELDY
jgi:hypothetical protein